MASPCAACDPARRYEEHMSGRPCSDNDCFECAAAYYYCRPLYETHPQLWISERLVSVPRYKIRFYENAWRHQRVGHDVLITWAVSCQTPDGHWYEVARMADPHEAAVYTFAQKLPAKVEAVFIPPAGDDDDFPF